MKCAKQIEDIEVRFFGRCKRPNYQRSDHPQMLHDHCTRCDVLDVWEKSDVLRLLKFASNVASSWFLARLLKDVLVKSQNLIETWQITSERGLPLPRGTPA
jgi:hypothetical protein